ncbi:fumarylacetoacetase [Rhodoplanes sp. Z2-YC6860]|uniref:fumarylacetoacetase n=1 Tax=Rhodoplanes sp. Z2-YC6860 TaxID=674703 RepID=UPI00078BCD58|nr:fumarylacetoacetase [Rhodoplanes sp. Z2-YC6860]AMN39287.1 fumarylacetoacetase [Rhodoplanes sp. Z2-YC6860]
MAEIELDETHDPARRSWVETANRPDGEFPIQNLPYGVFRRNGSDRKQIGVAIGEAVLDVAGLASRLGETIAGAADFLSAPSLAPLMAQPSATWTALRQTLGRMLEAGSGSRGACEPYLLPANDVELAMPVRPGSFSDFFASIQHATNAGSLFRPTSPLMPNYKHVPIAYNGRASTIGVGGDIRRPNGQRKLPDRDAPDFGPSRRLDYEMELGIFLGGNTRIGQPVPIAQAWQHIFGVCLLNDWSARDIQAWEYQPLGPFLGKSFATSISPWIVTADALRPFRVRPRARTAEDPGLLPYLNDPADREAGALAVDVETWVRSESMAARGLPPVRFGAASTADLFWTPAQMVAHQTSNGCNIEAGDLYGSGTVSGNSRDSLGSLLEITRGGSEPIALSEGLTRTFLEDGDEVIMTAHCRRTGFASIGFGRCRGKVLASI